MAQKGIPHSPEMRAKLSASAKLRAPNFLGKHHSSATREKIRRALLGRKNPHVGYPLSDATKLKLSLALKGHAPWTRGMKHTDEAKKKIGDAGRGELNFRWKGGITPILMKIRLCSKTQDWRQRVFFRDDFTCQECGRRGGRLHAHHLKRFSILIQEVRQFLPLLDLYDAAISYSPLWDISNGVTLCEKRHLAIPKEGAISKMKRS